MAAVASVEAVGGRRSPSTRSVVLRFLSNIMFGAAVGLLAYYGITNVVNARDQAVLAAELGPVGSAGRTPPMPSIETTQMDLTSWAQEDEPHWQGLAEGAAFARLVIPAMDLDVMVVKGTEPTDLKRGPGWIVKTDLPGATGNVGISGHRTTYGHPFGKLDVLKKGDTIDLYSPYRRYRYTVERSFIVTPNRFDVVSHTEEPRLTLTACHPPYSARYRLIVQATLTDVRKVTAAAEGP